MGGHDVLPPEAEALDRPGAEVLGHHVEVRGEVEHELPAGLGLEVDGDGALGEVVAQERGPDGATLRVGHGRKRAATEVARTRGLHLDDLCTEAAEQLRGEGQRLHLLERQDPHTLKGLRPGAADDVADVEVSGHALGRSSEYRSIALLRMTLLTWSWVRPAATTMSRAMASVSGHVESVWG